MINKPAHTKIILIADSSGVNIPLLGKRLKAEGFGILTATSGKQALAIAQSKQPDMILIDAATNELNGFEVCKLVKEQDPSLVTSILIMSELADLSEIEKAYDAGADDFISIPYQLEEVVGKIHNILKQKEQFSDSDTKKESGPVKKILLVEDNELNRNYISAIIHDLGYTLDIADNGAAALSFVSTKTYDLILSDINVPLIDGLELTRIIREKYSKDVPVIAISGHSEEEVIDECIAADMSAFLTKPFTAKELKEIMAYFFTGNEDQSENISSSTSDNIDEGIKKYDYSRVLEMADGDQELFTKWFTSFKETVTSAYANVNEVIESGEFPKRNKLFHELINYSGYFGLDELRSFIQEYSTVQQFTEDKERLENFYKKIRRELENIQDFYKHLG